MSEEEITKQDILNVTGSMFETMLDFADNSHKEIESLQQEKENLIKYLKDNIEVLNNQKESIEGLDVFECHALTIYEDILERVKSGKYE